MTGEAKYAGGLAFPGMLHARIVRPPAHGATLTSADTAAAEAFEGARVVRDGDLIAVLHERPDQAEKAFDLIKAQFDRAAPTVDDKTIFDHLVKAAPPGQTVGESGRLQEGENEEVRFKGGEILDRNFDTYEIPRFSWLPQIETILVYNPDVPASGCGEPPVVCMGAVVANAIYDAVGARLFQLPMTPARVKEALRRT